MTRFLFALSVTCALAFARPCFSLSVAPATPDERVQNAAAICHATVLGAESFRSEADGGIYTRTWLRVNEAFKGKFPATITVVHRGGRVGEEGEVSSDAPKLKVGDERLFLLGQRADGTLFVDNGSSGAPPLARAGTGKTATSTVTDPNALALLSAARSRYPSAAGPDLTGQTVSLLVPLAVPGLATNASGTSRRFTAGDRGEVIEYLVDTDALPAGMTQAQALNAVSNAFQAWASVTSLRFRYAGVTSFGTAAGNVATNDGRIRLQLHDLYNSISGSTTLGVGGNSFSISGTFPNGGMGGSVAGNEFFPVSYGYLVMKHTRTTLTNLLSFEEVLCHEIGHVLSMDHSSESASEPNNTLKQAIMYFQAHADGRGAQLGSYDPPVVQQAYPTNNTPPYGYSRVMDVVTQPSGAPNIAGINQIEVRGYDAQTTNLTLSITSSTAGAGAFSLQGATLKFTPSGFFGADRVDPATTSAYDRAYLRFSDGTNGSPYIEVRVVSLLADQNPSGSSDGLPDNWVAQYFGSASASVNPNADADGDGISNLNEFRLGTNPTNAASVLRFTSSSASGVNWFATAYEVYEVQATTDFTNWFRAGNPVVPTTTNGSFTNIPSVSGLFFRVERVGGDFTVPVSIETPPAISAQPVDQAVGVGQTASFSVTGTGTGPLAYQWRKDGIAVGEKTNAILSLSNVQTSQAGAYTVVITNAYGSVTSSVATLTVASLPPTITAQPTNQVFSVGQTANFSVTATGTLPLSYQWQRDGGNLSEATNSTLTLGNLQTNQAGSYVVIVSNAWGSVTSSIATLIVTQLSQTITFGPLLPRGVDAGPFTLNATTSSGLPVNYSSSDPAVATVSGTTLTLTGIGTTTLTASQPGNAVFLPANSVSQFLSITGIPPSIVDQPLVTTVLATSNASITVSTSGSAPMAYQWFGLTSKLSLSSSVALVFGGFVFEMQLTSGGSGYVQPPAVRLVGGGGNGAAVTASVSNGAVIALTIVNPGAGYTSPPAVQIDPPTGFLLGQTNATLTLLNASSNDTGTYYVAVTNAYGSVTSSPIMLTVYVPATITQQPQSMTIGFGSNATLTVGSSGTMPLSYQWFWQPGFARAALAVPDVRNGFVVGASVVSGGGYYFSPPAVQILAGSGGGASATTSISNGRVTAVNIVTPGSGYPSNAVIQIDSPPAGLARSLSGQTAASLSLTAPDALTSGSYFVVVTNAGGSVTSSPALLRVLVPQRFTHPPERLGDGSFRLRFVAHDGSYLLTNDLTTLEIWASTNLANTNAWIRITNGITVQDGGVQVDDLGGPGLSRRFYRVLTR